MTKLKEPIKTTLTKTKIPKYEYVNPIPLPKRNAEFPKNIPPSNFDFNKDRAELMNEDVIAIVKFPTDAVERQLFGRFERDMGNYVIFKQNHASGLKINVEIPKQFIQRVETVKYVRQAKQAVRREYFNKWLDNGNKEHWKRMLALEHQLRKIEKQIQTASFGETDALRNRLELIRQALQEEKDNFASARRSR